MLEKALEKDPNSSPALNVWHLIMLGQATSRKSHCARPGADR